MKIGDVCYLFIFYSYLYHSKEHRKAIVYLMAFNTPNLPIMPCIFYDKENSYAMISRGKQWNIHLSLVFSWYTHAKRLEKIQVTLGIFHGLPLKSIA